MTEEELLKKVKFELRREHEEKQVNDAKLFVSERNLLEKVKDILKDYEKKRRDNALGFNIFDITGIYFDGGMGNKSVYENPMQRVLYELLNPEGSHGMGTTYLKQFFKDILDLTTDDYELEHSKVEIEKIVPQGRIDIIIETPYRFIPIELKTQSAEGENQCARYINVAKEKNKNNKRDWKLFFLTQDGIDANLNESEKKYCCSISWKNDITLWLKNIIKIEYVNRVNVLEIIKQYLATVEKFTNQNEEGLQMELNKLINDSETMKAAVAITRGLFNVKKKLYEILVNNIKEQFKLKFPKYEKCDENIASEDINLGYKIKNINETNFLAVNFNVDNGICYLGFTAENNCKDKDILEKAKMCLAIPPDKISYIDEGGKWFAFIKLEDLLKNQYSNIPNFEECDDNYCDLFDDGKRQYFVNQVVNGFSELISWVN